MEHYARIGLRTAVVFVTRTNSVDARVDGVSHARQCSYTVFPRDLQLMAAVDIEYAPVGLLGREDCDFEGLCCPCRHRVGEMHLAGSVSDGSVKVPEVGIQEQKAHALAWPVYDSVRLCSWKPWFWRCVQDP